MFKEYLTSIADSIRAKLGTSEKINAQSYADKISEVYDAGYAKGAEEGGGINPEWTDWQYFSVENNRNELVKKIKYNDTSKGVKFSYMFSNCGQLTSVPLFDTSNGTTFACMFQTCRGLTYIPSYDTSNGTAFGNMFSACSGLLEAPMIDTGKGKTFGNLFYQCTNLKTIPQIDMSNATYVGSAFSGCSALENVTFVGTFPIKANTTVFSQSPKLTVDSLMSFINALTNTGTATYTVTIGSTNLAKLTQDQIDIATAKNIVLA